MSRDQLLFLYQRSHGCFRPSNTHHLFSNNQSCNETCLSIRPRQWTLGIKKFNLLQCLVTTPLSCCINIKETHLIKGLTLILTQGFQYRLLMHNSLSQYKLLMHNSLSKQLHSLHKDFNFKKFKFRDPNFIKQRNMPCITQVFSPSMVIITRRH